MAKIGAQRPCPNRENRKNLQEKKKHTKKTLNEIEASNLPEKKFKSLVIRMHKEFSENFNKEITSIKNIITERKNTLEGINSRLHKPGDQSSDLKDQVAKNTQSEQQK